MKKWINVSKYRSLKGNKNVMTYLKIESDWKLYRLIGQEGPWSAQNCKFISISTDVKYYLVFVIALK